MCKYENDEFLLIVYFIFKFSESFVLFKLTIIYTYKSFVSFIFKFCKNVAFHRYTYAKG